MARYKCYYCDNKLSDFEQIIEHLCSKHDQETLKYRELELDEQTGKFGYRTKTHIDVVPNLKTINVTTDNKISVSVPYSFKKSKHESVSIEKGEEVAQEGGE